MKRAFWALIASALLSLGAQEACGQSGPASPEVIQVDVNTSNAAGLLRSMFDFAGYPLVSVAPAYVDPIEFQGQHPNWSALLDALVERLHMQVVAQNKILVVRPACSRLQASPPGPASTEKLSLHFERLPLTTLFELLNIAPLIAPADQALINRTAVTLRLRDAPVGDLLQAVATAVGFQWAGDAATGWRLQRGGVEDCAFTRPRSHQDPHTALWMGRAGKACPYRAQSEDKARSCQPMEMFALHTLRPAGHVKWRGRVVALVERPDGALQPTHPGDYLGRDFGKVMKIERDGLEISEIIQDGHDVWVEKAQTLRFGAFPKPTQPLRFRRQYIQSGSPQAAYEAELTTLSTFSRQWADVLNLCAQHHPSVSQGQSEALMRWRARNATALNEINRHVEAFAALVASDYAVPTRVVLQVMQENSVADVAGRFKIAGELSSASARAVCAAQVAWLDDPDNDLDQRFPQALAVIRQCKDVGACPRLDGRVGD